MIKKMTLAIATLLISYPSFANGLEAIGAGLVIYTGYLLVLGYSILTMLFYNADGHSMVTPLRVIQVVLVLLFTLPYIVSVDWSEEGSSLSHFSRLGILYLMLIINVIRLTRKRRSDDE